MKIAIISTQPHFCIGGIERTLRLKYSFLAENNDVTEYPLVRRKKNRMEKPNKFVKIDYLLAKDEIGANLKMTAYKKKNLQHIYNNNDVVILETFDPPRKWLRHKKSILVQHSDFKTYTPFKKGVAITIGGFFINIFFNIGTFFNPLKKSAKTVTFIEHKNIKNSVAISLPANYENQISVKNPKRKRKGFVWIARLDDESKDLIALAKLSNLYGNISIYGDGPDKKLLIQNLEKKEFYKGFLEHEKVQKIMSTSKATLITSKYEGFPNTIVESLSTGTPVVLFDTFTTAKFFETSGAAFLVEKNDIEGYANKLKWLDSLNDEEYKKIQIKAIDFAKKYLSFESYEYKWKTLLSEYK